MKIIDWVRKLFHFEYCEYCGVWYRYKKEIHGLGSRNKAINCPIHGKFMAYKYGTPTNPCPKCYFESLLNKPIERVDSGSN